MITRALESKEKRKDSKRIKKEKDGLNAAAFKKECHDIRRIHKTGSSFNVAALRSQCCNIGKNNKTSFWQNSGCRDIDYSMPQHAWTRAKTNKLMLQH